jgi:hypothetical protein
MELFGAHQELIQDERVKKQLDVILSSTLEAQRELVSKFDERRITPQEFQQQASEEHKRALSDVKKLIGEKKFYEIFGPAGDKPELIADPKPFFERFGN